MKQTIIVGLIIAMASVTAAQKPPDKNSVVEYLVGEVSESNLKSLVDKLVSFGTRHTLSDTTSATRGIGAARRWIKSEFEKYAKESKGQMTVEFHESIVQPSARVPKPTKIVNVVATLRPKGFLPGNDRRMLVIGGHYDTRASDPLDAVSDAPGANDDGSGTALVLELARVLAKTEIEATLVFIAFAGEEQGLLGALQWAEMARQKGWNIEAMLNNDIVGSSVGGDGREERSYVRLFSEAYSPVDTGTVFRMRNNLGLENDGPSRSLARYVSEIAANYVPNFGAKMVYRRDRFLRGGDHSPFHERGFAAVRFSVARENYDWQHQNVRTEDGKQYGDLPQFMDFPYLTSVARVNIAAFATLALAPAPPADVGIVVRELGYDTHLRWRRNSEADVSGYYVRYRETSSPVWQHSIFTKDTTIALNVLKDDYLFGVQAVDNDGNVSLVVLPRPVR